MENDNEILETENLPEETLVEPAAQTEPSELESLQSQLAELNDKYLRTAAELENTRRRAEIDAANSARARAISISEKFLPLIDAIEAAASHAPDDAGISAMKKSAESVLENLGIKKIESIGKQLNPAMHNAIQITEASHPQSDENGVIKTIPNTIMEEFQAGYTFGDTVLRPAMVSVSGLGSKV